LRYHADRVDSAVLEVQGVDGDGGRHDDDEDTRQLGQQPVEEQDPGERDDPDHGRGGVGETLRQA
jgi:hypothetical protein